MSDACEHGGNLQDATERFGLPAGGWQDLSTGISPWGYPVSHVPSHVWQNLPVDRIPLMNAAQNFYGVSAECIFPVPGTQVAIAALPRLWPVARVAMPSCGYHEHEHHWTSAGHTPVFYSSAYELLELAKSGAVDHVVVVNPNNPTGQLICCDHLQKVYQSIAGVLLVDEAFMDFQPEHTMAAFVAQQPRLIVLRSVGKFFGLAGIRVGFVLSGNAQIKNIKHLFEPWGVSGPAMWVAERALTDSGWQQAQCLRIENTFQSLTTLLQGFTERLTTKITLSGAGLFVSLAGNHDLLHSLHNTLAERGIYTRWGYQCRRSATAYLRFGLPGDGGARLQSALNGIQQEWKL